MMASPMRRTSLSAPLRRSCSMRCSVREVSLRPRFSNGSSSRSSIDTGVRSSPWSSKIAEERSKGRSSARSPSTDDVSLDGCSGASGAARLRGGEASVVLVEAAVASAVSWVSTGISSRRGFSSQLLAHHLLQLEGGELEELDRLLQQRGHDDPLAHPLYRVS